MSIPSTSNLRRAMHGSRSGPPTNGWMAFDPTHNRQPDEEYVIVGYGRSYDDVPPNRGIYSGTASESLVAKVVTRPGTGREQPRLVEQAQHIDLPVYREIPEREGPAEITAGEAAVSQQQQQQQADMST